MLQFDSTDLYQVLTSDISIGVIAGLLATAIWTIVAIILRYYKVPNKVRRSFGSFLKKVMIRWSDKTMDDELADDIVPQIIEQIDEAETAFAKLKELVCAMKVKKPQNFPDMQDVNANPDSNDPKEEKNSE